MVKEQREDKEERSITAKVQTTYVLTLLLKYYNIFLLLLQ